MTPAEVEFLVDMAVACFPNTQQRNMGPTFEAWLMLLGHLGYDVAKLALAKYVTGGAKFFPAPGELLAHADEILNPGRLSAAEAWAEVMAAVRYVGYMNAPKWTTPAVAKAVEGVGGWQYICASETQMADRSHFLRLYEVEARREKERALMPPLLQEAIANIQIKGMPSLNKPAMVALPGGKDATA